MVLVTEMFVSVNGFSERVVLVISVSGFGERDVVVNSVGAFSENQRESKG